MTLYLPALNAIFRTQPLPAGALAIGMAPSSVVFLAFEVETTLVRRAGCRDRPAATT
jgi:Ca2+-transporting ATPase